MGYKRELLTDFFLILLTEQLVNGRYEKTTRCHSTVATFATKPLVARST